ncbi:MAG TPA: hypothetical protein DHN33_11135, partial [Eubacteriaceae bacterium]|nr:hypothetical protein [Eubacteriaceae bacterium]
MKIKNILHYLPSSKSEMTSKEAYESRICAIAPIKKQPTGNDSQTIYYGLSTDFTQQTDAKFILSDKPVSLQYGKECNFILTNKKDLYKAVNTIEDLLAQDRLLTEYKNDMFEALIEKKSLSSILSKTFEYLENPIIVTDSRYRLIELYPDKKLNEPVWDSIREKGHAPQELMDQIESDQTKEKTLGSTYPFILNWGFAENFRRIAGKIHDDKRFFGVIGVLESYRSFKRIDLEIVHELSKIIRNQIVATNPPNEEEISYQQTLLTNLIDGDIEDERQLSNSLNMSGVRWNKPYQFVVIPFNINNFNLSVLRSLQKELLTKLQDAQATVHLSN